eukprot:scaffold1572_cov272-Pinguiococcus_pyrenoidosus.AAC.6
MVSFGARAAFCPSCHVGGWKKERSTTATDPRGGTCECKDGRRYRIQSETPSRASVGPLQGGAGAALSFSTPPFPIRASPQLRLLKIRLSERELQHSLELERVQLALQEEGNLRESLERKVNFLSSEERRLRGDLRAKASEIVELKSGFNAQLQSAKQQGEELQEENAQLSQSKGGQRRRLLISPFVFFAKVSGLEVELQRVRRRTSDKQQEGDPSELRNLREQNTLLEAQLLSLQGGAADAIAKAPEQRQGEDEDLPVEDLQAMRMARMRIAELERLVRKLRREIDAYKEQSRSQLVAEEEIRSLKDSLSREKKHREASLQRVAAAETERSAATTALEEAKAVEKKNREAFLSRVADAEREQSAAAVALEEAKATVQRLLAEKEGLEHRGRALEETIREREKQISFFSTQAAQRETAMDAILDRLHTKGESNLAEDRVQQLRGELENSEAERARLGERLAMLEGSLQEALKRKDAADLARNLEVQQLREGLSMARIDLKTAEEQLCALRARAPAQSDAAQGRDRILHAKDNPYVEALKEKVAAQKKEIANLSKELKALADSSQGSSGSGESVNAAKLRQRLKTMFAERVKVLREAVYLLTGAEGLDGVCC